MTNQTSEGLIYITTQKYRGFVDGMPQVDRYLLEFDPITRETQALFNFEYRSGDSGAGMDLAMYESEDGVGIYFSTYPNPQSIYHITPEGLRYLQESYSPSNIPSFIELNRQMKTDSEMILIERLASSIPVDSWGMGANVTPEGIPYVVIGSNWGPLLFYQKP